MAEKITRTGPDGTQYWTGWWIPFADGPLTESGTIISNIEDFPLGTRYRMVAYQGYVIRGDTPEEKAWHWEPFPQQAQSHDPNSKLMRFINQIEDRGLSEADIEEAWAKYR